MEPGELLRPILAASPGPLDAEVVDSFEVGDVQQTNVRLLTGRVDGKEIRMFVRLCVPQGREGPLPTLLLIPGGRGTFTESNLASWIASTSGAIVCALDWIGSGNSDGIPGLDPWGNAIYWETDDIRDTFQFHQLRALLRARDYLLSHELADPTRLMGMGSSWGSFYSFLLGGLDPRFTHLFVTYGCGFFDIETRALWEAQLKSIPPERAELWLRAFDPGRRAHLITAKVFYQQATNDRYFGLTAAMATWDRIRTPKRLLLVPNIDHDLGPYNGQDVAMLEAARVGAWEEAMPELEAAWISGTNEVSVSVSDDRQATFTVYYAAGDYTGWAGRHWHAAPVLRGHDGSMRAHIPIIDPSRRIRFFAQAEWGSSDAPMAASSRVEAVVPLEQGFDRKTAEYDPRVDLTDEPFWRQPFTSGTMTKLDVVELDGRPRVRIQFANEGTSERAIYYGFEGDVAAAAGYDTVAFSLLVPKAEDAAALSIILVTDYYSESEQVYAVPLESLGLDYTSWQHIELPFSHFAPHGVRIENYLHGYETKLLPFTAQRLNGVGLMRTPPGTTPNALISDIVLKRSPRVSVAAEPADVDEPKTHEVVVETDLDPETLREQLAEWEPWRHEIVFSNGVRTSDLRKTEPFEYQPTKKWSVFQRHIPKAAIASGRALDLGCMIGQYSLMLGKNFGMSVVGVDDDERHIAVASFLRELSRLEDVSFLRADANHLRLRQSFDLVLLLDTLDYLRHPLLALENVYAMLAPDGYLALELQTYVSPDGLLSRFVRPDPSTGKEWSFGRNVILEMLGGCGFDRTEVIDERPSDDGQGMNVRQLSVVARKPSYAGPSES